MIGQSTFIRPESNAADPATLYGFFDWAAAECPADHYLLIFWGHSRGQFGMFGDSDPFDYTAQTLTLEELRNALTAAKRSLQKPVDVIAFKDCFMANLETAYELSGLADYLLASPGLVPVEGWPYEEIFNALTGPARIDRALDAAKRILKALEEYYEDKGKKAQGSAQGSAVLAPQHRGCGPRRRSIGGAAWRRTAQASIRLKTTPPKLKTPPARLGIQRSRTWVSWSATPMPGPHGARRGAPIRSRRRTPAKTRGFLRALGNAEPEL